MRGTTGKRQSWKHSLIAAVTVKALTLSVVTAWWLAGSPGMQFAEQVRDGAPLTAGSAPEPLEHRTPSDQEAQFAQLEQQVNSDLQLIRQTRGEFERARQRFMAERDELCSELRALDITSSDDLSSQSRVVRLARDVANSVKTIRALTHVIHQLTALEEAALADQAELDRGAALAQIGMSYENFDGRIIERSGIVKALRNRRISRVKPEQVNNLFDVAMRQTAEPDPEPSSFVRRKPDESTEQSTATMTNGASVDPPATQPNSTATRRAQPIEVKWPRLPRFVGPNGQPWVWYRQDGNGNYYLYDAPGSKRGVTLKPATDPTVNKRIVNQFVAEARLQSQAHGSLPAIEWFDPRPSNRRAAGPAMPDELALKYADLPPFTDADGNGLLYYHTSVFPYGTYDIYSKPGYHPIGERLKPTDDATTNQRIVKWIEQRDQRDNDE